MNPFGFLLLCMYFGPLVATVAMISAARLPRAANLGDDE